MIVAEQHIVVTVAVDVPLIDGLDGAGAGDVEVLPAVAEGPTREGVEAGLDDVLFFVLPSQRSADQQSQQTGCDCLGLHRCVPRECGDSVILSTTQGQRPHTSPGRWPRYSAHIVQLDVHVGSVDHVLGFRIGGWNLFPTVGHAIVNEEQLAGSEFEELGVTRAHVGEDGRRVRPRFACAVEAEHHRDGAGPPGAAGENAVAQQSHAWLDAFVRNQRGRGPGAAFIGGPCDAQVAVAAGTIDDEESPVVKADETGFAGAVFAHARGRLVFVGYGSDDGAFAPGEAVVVEWAQET